MVLGLLIVTCAIPVAAVLSRGYCARIVEQVDQQTRAWHQVDATVVELRPTVPDRFRAPVRYVRARWDAGVGTGDRIETVQAPSGVAVGDHLNVWLNAHGAVVPAPQEQSDSRANAIAYGVEVWMGVVGLTGAAVLTTRELLNRRRFAAWDDEWELLSAGGGEWTDHDRVD